ncbi:MAG: hypothetical protein EKK41_20615 [Hyphomicrobiales bacterium]|nr:MAG: hypothetical protein EKK41_20615 [Hyphomicrobiales bacterium]
MRKIVRRVEDDAPSAEETAKRISGQDGVTILDLNASSLLVEGESEAIDAALRGIDGWNAFALSTIQVPDTRQRIGKTARKR